MKLLENSGETQVGVIQISKETLSRRQIREICDSLRHQYLTVLALRECLVDDSDYKKLVKSVAVCESLLQLNFNVNVVNSEERVTLLARCLRKNKSLKSLYLHGSDLSGGGLETLCHSLSRHPSLISLDLGDCQLNDDSLEYVIPLLAPRGRFQGLVELGLSGNAAISGAAWCRLFQSLALAHSHTRLISLYLDYCRLGNKALTCLATALASLATVRTLDLENTGITDQGAQFLLYLAAGKKENRLKTLNLHGNDLDPQLVDAIQSRLVSSPTPSSVDSDSDSESEFMKSRPDNTMLSEMLSDPAKVEALHTLSRALTDYTIAMDRPRSETGEDIVEQENVGDVEAAPYGDLTGERSSPPPGGATSAEQIPNDDASDHAEATQDADDDAASQTSDKTMETLSSLSDKDFDDDVIVGDVVQVVHARVSFAEPEEDLGDFLREIPCAATYPVITPVTFKSRAISYSM